MTLVGPGVRPHWSLRGRARTTAVDRFRELSTGRSRFWTTRSQTVELLAAGTLAQDYVQLLIAPRIEQLLHGAASQGLPTGSRTRDGQMRYLNAFWQMCYDVLQVYRLYLPQMIGRGGNKVALYPGGIAPVRIARSAPARVGAQNETTAPVTAATRLVPFCR